MQLKVLVIIYLVCSVELMSFEEKKEKLIDFCNQVNEKYSLSKMPWPVTFMSEIFGIFFGDDILKISYSTVSLNNYTLYGRFGYRDKGCHIYGPATITRQGKKLFSGRIYCETGCFMLGDYY